MTTERSADFNLERQKEAVRALMDAYRAEVADDEELALDMIEGETEFFEALDAIIDLYHRDGETITGIKDRAAKLSQRKARIEGRQKRFKAMMQQALAIAGIQKAERPEATISITRVPPKLAVTNESQLPTDFFVRPDPKVDTKAIKASDAWAAFMATHKAITAIKMGKQVPPELYTARDEAEEALYVAIPGIAVEIGLDTVSVRAA